MPGRKAWCWASAATRSAIRPAWSRWLSSKGGLVRLRPDHKLAIVREMDVATRLRFARDTLEALAGIVGGQEHHRRRCG